jgi:hypothetical protein
MKRRPRRTARCPVCHNHVNQTIHGNIEGHFDKAKRPCPASGETFDISLRAVS